MREIRICTIRTLCRSRLFSRLLDNVAPDGTSELCANSQSCRCHATARESPYNVNFAALGGDQSPHASYYNQQQLPNATLLRPSSNTNYRYMHVGPGEFSAKVPVNQRQLPHFAPTWPTSSSRYQATLSRIACQLALWLCGL